MLASLVPEDITEPLCSGLWGARDRNSSPQVVPQTLPTDTFQPRHCEFLNSKFDSGMLPPPPPATLVLGAYLQLAMPFTFTQMPSFWHGFGSQGSLKYCGQLWSSMGPVFFTERFCRLGCSWSRLLGRAFSNMALPELSLKTGGSWPWRRRPRETTLWAGTGTSVWLRCVRSSGSRPRQREDSGLITDCGWHPLCKFPEPPLSSTKADVT